MLARLVVSVLAVVMATAVASDDVWLKIKECQDSIDCGGSNCTSYVLKHSEACFKPKNDRFGAVPFRCEKFAGAHAVWFQGHQCITNASSTPTQYYCDTCRVEVPELTLCNMTNRSMTRYLCDTCKNSTNHSGCTPLYTVGFDTCSYVQGAFNGEGSLLLSGPSTVYRILYTFGQFDDCFANISTPWTSSMPTGQCDWTDGTDNIQVDCIPAAKDERPTSTAGRAGDDGMSDTVYVESIDEIPAKVMLNVMKRFSRKNGA